MTIKVLIQLFVAYFAVGVVFCAECEKLPDFETLEKCCETPDLVIEEYVKACEVPEGETTNIWIAAECYFKNAGAIVNGQPSAAEIKKKVKPALANYSDWEPVFNAAVDKCVPEVIAKDAETRKRVSEPPFNIKDVNTMYTHLLSCIDVELLFKCPTADRLDGPKCTVALEYVKNCSKVFPAHFIVFEGADD